MKKTLLPLLLTLCLVMPFGLKAYGAAYYVSSQGNDTWSGTLPAPNGSGDGPFRTIAKAVAAMRAGKVKITFVRQGEYSQNGTSIVLNSLNSNDQLLAYPGEHPIISGGFRVVSWQREPSIAGAWSAPLPAKFNTVSPTNTPPVVSFNSQWMDCARTPNLPVGSRYQTGYFYVSGPVNPVYPPDFGTDNSFTFRNSDLTPQIYSGEPTAGVVIWDKLGWSCDPIAISSINFSTGTVHLVGGSQFGISNDSRYYIYGTKGSLDVPGEYYMDTANRRLWLIPPGNLNPNKSIVVISESEGPAVIDIKSANKVLIAGFQIQDQDNSGRWMNSVANYAPQKGGVRIDNGNQDVIEGNIFSCLGIGIDLEGENSQGAGAVGTLVSNNEIFDTVGGGINMSGKNEAAVGNFIHDIGLIEQAGRGISSGPTPNYIGYNLIANTPHDGIISGNGQYPADGLLIEYNALLHTSQGDHDTGAVYLKNEGNYTPSAPETVRFNTFRDTGGFIAVADPSTGAISTYFPNWSWAVYLDEGQSNTNIYGNLVNLSGDGGVFAHDGTLNNIFNNIVANATGNSLVMQGQYGNNPLGNVFSDNIFYSTAAVDPILVEQNGTQGALSKNIYWNPAYTVYNSPGSPFVDYNDGTATQTFSQWQGAREDAGSKQADPLFVSPATYDFSLQSGSPAFANGFQPLPLDQMGPQGYSPSTTLVDCGSKTPTGSWSADVSVTGGSQQGYPDSIDTSAAGSAPAAVYDTYRQGTFEYKIKNLAPGSIHVIRLHFVEEWYGIASRGGSAGVGKRLFDVTINGHPELTNFDAYAAAGGADIADVEQVIAAANSNGVLAINFTPSASSPDQHAIVSGVEVDPPTLPQPVVQINASGPSAGAWTADEDYSGGNWGGVGDTIDTSFAYHPAPAGVYDTYRYGTFSYTIANLVPGSTHLVRLHFAELWYGIAGRGGAGTGLGVRVFNVAINSAPALSNFDVFAQAGGPDTAITRQFIATADNNGIITISFAPAPGSFDQNAMVSGIEVY